jgi:hypothetical protein
MLGHALCNLLSQNPDTASTVGTGAGIFVMSEPGETRTLDPRIKSALLYRLSYRLIERALESRQ